MLRPFAVLLLAVFAEGYKAPNIIMMIADGTFTATNPVVVSFSKEFFAMNSASLEYTWCTAIVRCCMRAHNLCINVYPTANLCGTRYHDGAAYLPPQQSFTLSRFLSVGLF